MGIQIGSLDQIVLIPSQQWGNGSPLISAPYNCSQRNEVIANLSCTVSGDVTGVGLIVQTSPDGVNWAFQTIALVAQGTVSGMFFTVPTMPLAYAFSATGYYAVPVQVEAKYVRFGVEVTAGSDTSTIALDIMGGQV